ncbi:MAG: glycoside hydrolase family 32 protein [Verrucomicrobia bacterium]|nr:glycoside hydrolase family 32 protein [Verrucomicrobiota bacterium]
MKKTTLLMTFLSLALFTSAAASVGFAAEDILLNDFEGAGYGTWKVEGTAFGTAPAKGTLPGQREVAGFEGKGLVNTYLNGDGTTGALTSPPFTIQRGFINFKIGGGGHETDTCMNLTIDEQIVRTATGPNDERLEWVNWDVKEYAGRKATLQIVDRATGGWGHLCVDQIVQSDVGAGRTLTGIQNSYHEACRPQFHFTARKNWLNDPNGLVFYEGEYHLCYQHNPTGLEGGNQHWGHAVSPDLVHWKELPIALRPDVNGAPWSGSAVVDWNNTAGLQQGREKPLVAIYTGAGPRFTQCLAVSNDRGRTWQAYEHNPVLGHINGGNRDPKVIWHAPTKRWIMALDLDNAFYALFASPDLKKWEHLQDMQKMAQECPDFYPLPLDGGSNKAKWVFVGGNGSYRIGSFDGRVFTPETPARAADYGNHYYAPQTFSDIPAEDGRRIQIAWMKGGRYPGMPFNQQMNFPTELTLRSFPEGPVICRLPTREISNLYGKTHKWKNQDVTPDGILLREVAGGLYDIELEADLGDSEEFGIKCRGEAVTCLPKRNELTCLGRGAPLQAVNQRIKLRILVDRTSLEVYANDGRVVMTSCFLPAPEDTGLEMFSKGGAARILAMEIHELKSAWPE